MTLVDDAGAKSRNVYWADLDDPAVEWVGAGQDDMGDVFKLRGRLFRAIKKSAQPYVDKLISRGVFDHLSRAGLVPSTKLYEVQHPKYAAIAIMEMHTFLYPPFYALRALREAALKWIEINQFLFSVFPGEVHCLRDGHYGNFVITRNSIPLWCDIGSISSRPAHLTFGIDEFIRCYVYPFLIIISAKSSAETRKRMHQSQSGIARDQARGLISDEFDLSFLEQASDLQRRAEILSRLRSLIEGIDFNDVKAAWAGYRGPGALQQAWSGKLLEDGQDTRYRAIVDLVRTLSVRTFIDVGANDGLFSLLCCREGLSGTALDIEDAALNRLYDFIRQLPAVHLKVGYSEFLGPPREAELVLALALTHHLSLSQGLSFSAIGKRLAQMANRCAITEFMADGLGGTPGHPLPHPNPLPEWYTLENFVVSMRESFRHVEVIDYHRPMATSRRILVLCGGPLR